MMNSTFAKTTIGRNISVACKSNMDPRKLAQEYRIDTQWAQATPATGTIIVSCGAYTITFDCKQDRSDWQNAMQNVLVGLGFYRTTSTVPEELTNPTSDAELTYTIEWGKVPDIQTATAATPDKTRPAIHSLAG
jgi:hypothetical protein